MNKIYIIILIVVLFTSCNSSPVNTANGIFETDEITVSNEISGPLTSVNVDLGDDTDSGQVVARVDTIQLYLQKQLLVQNKSVLLNGRPDVNAQIKSLKNQLDKQKFEKVRVEKLLSSDAATGKQLDDINSQIEVIQSQIDALKSSLGKNLSSIDAQCKAVDIQIDQINDKINRCKICTPCSGTVINKYINKGELAGSGMPIIKIADLKHIYLRVYLTSRQLSLIKTGQKVNVNVSGSDKKYSGTLVWISNVSEFTPKNIQSADERENSVYAAKVAVDNDGYIRSGMYGNIIF